MKLAETEWSSAVVQTREREISVAENLQNRPKTVRLYKIVLQNCNKITYDVLISYCVYQLKAS